MDEIMFRMDDSLLSAADDFYKGSWSGLDAVKAGGVGAEVLHTGDYQKTANPLSLILMTRR
jgi:hypothetical protein